MMLRTPEIVVVGSHAPALFVRVKRVPVAGETVIGWDLGEPVDGGKGSNQAIAAARLGASVSFVGCLGDDQRGRCGETWMIDAGVATGNIIWIPDVPTGAGLTILDDESKPAMVVTRGANAMLSKAHVKQTLDGLAGARVLLTQFEIDPDVALEAAEIARGHGMISVVNPSPVPQGMPLRRMAVDVLVPNEIEAMQLAGEGGNRSDSPLALADRLRERAGAGCVMVTLGERGVAVSNNHGTFHISAPGVPAVDTSGAGDAFCAALAVALARGSEKREAAVWSCSVAALSVTRLGTIPSFPTSTEVADFIGALSPGAPASAPPLP